MLNEAITQFVDLIKSTGQLGIFLQIIILTAIIIGYISFVFYFYRIVSERNIIDLNLEQYNTTNNPFFSKLSALAFYILEYLIIMPFLITIWFIVLASILLVLAKNLSVHQIFLFSAAIIASVRFSAYINTKMAEDLAKIVPLTILTLAIIGENFFSIQLIIERISQIPSLFNNIIYYVIFVIILEFLLRIIIIPEELREKSAE